MQKGASIETAKLSEQLTRLMLSSIDFRHALSAATFLLEECDWDARYRNEELRRFKCYETTLVVTYSRPFSRSRGRSAPFRWALLGKAFELLPEEKVLHDKMIELRNKLHAHSDDDFTSIEPQIWRTKLPNGANHDFRAILGGEQLYFTGT